MATQKGKTVRNIPIRIACVLLCLTLVSIYLTSGLYARYMSSATGNDSARVIQFGNITLTEEGSSPMYDGEFVIIPGVDITKNPIVNFEGSEAATFVFVEIELSSHWETDNQRDFTALNGGVTWSVNSTWKHHISIGTKHVYYVELSPNNALENQAVIVDGKIKVSSSVTASDLATLADMSIDLHATAIQANGFASAAEAWNLISTP